MVFALFTTEEMLFLQRRKTRCEKELLPMSVLYGLAWIGRPLFLVLELVCSSHNLEWSTLLSFSRYLKKWIISPRRKLFASVKSLSRLGRPSYNSYLWLSRATLLSPVLKINVTFAIFQSSGTLFSCTDRLNMLVNGWSICWLSSFNNRRDNLSGPVDLFVSSLSRNFFYLGRENAHEISSLKTVMPKPYSL